MIKKIVILISGQGSNMQAIINANIQNAEIAAIISNRKESPGLLWAQQQGFNTLVLTHEEFCTRESYDLALMQLIDPFKPDLIVLAGFMRILGQTFCEHYVNRLINIHPSLLPAFPGLNTHQNAIDSGCKVAGCTVHFVTPELDSGPIIAQAVVNIVPDETSESLAKKVLKYEHIIYPQAIQDFICGRLSIKNNQVLNTRIKNHSAENMIVF